MPRIHKRISLFSCFLCLFLFLSCPPLFAQDSKDQNIAIPQHTSNELIITISPRKNHAEAIFSALIEGQKSLDSWFESNDLDAVAGKVDRVEPVLPFSVKAEELDALSRSDISPDSAKSYSEDLQSRYQVHFSLLQKKFPKRALRRSSQSDNDIPKLQYTYLVRIKKDEDLELVKKAFEKVSGVRVDFNWVNQLFSDSGQGFQRNTKTSSSKGGGLSAAEELPTPDQGTDGKPHYTGPNGNSYFNSSGNISAQQTYQDLYGIHLINAGQAWNFSDPVSLGWGTTVAVIDTGVDYLHPDISGNIWHNQGEVAGNNVDDDGNGYIDDVRGWDFNGNGDNDPMDTALPYPSSSGHGTHCAGIIAAENNNIGIIGVAPLAKIMALRVFPSGDDSRLAQAIYYAVNNGADVLSCSWGGLGRFVEGNVLKEAIDYAYAQGCVIVFAAGNNGDYGWPYADVGNSRPANYHKTIAVAATNWLDQKAHFSSYGELVDISAPGENILSLRAAGTDMAYSPQQNNALANCVPNGDPNAQYYVSSGTSMACPFVSGLAALLVAKINQTADVTSPWFHLTNNEIRERIKRTSDNIYSVSANQGDTKQHRLGSGRIDVAGALTDPFDWVENAPVTLAATDTEQSQTTVQQIFPALDHGDAAWGDYDNDGYLDLILMGRMKEKTTGYDWPIVRIYHNKGKDVDGQVALEDSGIQLYMEGDSGSTFDGAEDGNVTWGDYNKDGFLDLVVAGGCFTGIYRNKGIDASGNSLGFTRILTDIPDIAQGSVAWIDYDNDGDLDLLIAGKASAPATLCKIYRNDGNDTFTVTNTIDFGTGSGQGFYDGSVAVGDYDQDGDADIAISGIHAGVRKTYLLENTPSGFIVHDSAQTNLPNVSNGSLAFGDYDQDGDLDLLVTGDLDGSTHYVASVYRNDGNGQFTSLGGDCFALPSDMSNSYGLKNGSAVWGDYDNDGDLDVLLTGQIYINQSSATRIYFNNLIDPQEPAKAFSYDANAVFPPLRYSKVLWADYDKDYDLDVFIFGGNPEYLVGQQPFPITNLYRNNAWEYRREQFDRNAAPMPPTGLTMSYEYVQGKVNIVYKWDPSEDNETLERFKTTGAQGLSYNLVIGTKPDNCLMKSPMSYFHPWWIDISSGAIVTVPGNYSDGFMRLVRLGPQDYTIDSNGKVTWTLKGLSSAEYYPWGVQAVDAAFAGSPFAYYYATGPGMPVQKISGKVWDVNANAGIPGVRVKATPGSYGTTDANGNYYLYVPQGTNGTVWVEYYDQQVWNSLPTQPVNHVYTNITSDMLNQDFFVNIRLKGKVLDEMTGQGRPGILIGGENFGNNYFSSLLSVYSSISATAGNYDIGIPFGTLTRIRPLQVPTQYYIAVYSPYATHYSEGYVFSDRAKRDFRIKGVNISGYVYTASGWQLGDSWPPPAGTNFNPVANITISAVNTPQQSQTYGTFNTGATTNSSGFYKLKVPYGWHGTVTAIASCEAHPQTTSFNQWAANYIDYSHVEAEQQLQNFYMAGAIAHPYNTIKGKVWHDLDAAGDIDPNEPPIVGEIVQIVPTPGQILSSYTAITDAAGNYQAPLVADGTYIIKHQSGGLNPQTTGFVHSCPSAYAAQAIAQYQITVSNGQIVTAKDFGVHKPETAPGAVAGLVFNDVAGDGVYNVGTDTDGSAVLLLQGTTSSGLMFSQVLSAQGQYVFSNVPVGSYTLTMQPASGFVASTPTTINVAVSSGQTNGNNDFGEYLAGLIQGKVFWDQNADSIYDPGEPGIANTQVWIEKVGSGQPPVAITTDVNGFYNFNTLLTGTYRVFHQGCGSWTPIHTYPPSNGIVAGSPTVNNSNFAQYTAIYVASGQTITDINFGSRSPPGK